MKILMVSWEYPPVVIGGLGRHVHHLAVELAALGHDPCSLDDLVERTGQSADQLLPELLSLELGGSLAPLPGNRYQRLA